MKDYAEKPWVDREPEPPLRNLWWFALIGTLAWGIPIWILITG